MLNRFMYVVTPLIAPLSLLPTVLVAQGAAWAPTERPTITLELLAPTSANSEPGASYQTDGRTTGVLFLTGRIPVVGSLALETDLPVINFRETIDGCTDVYCRTEVRSNKIGNPYLGLRVALPSTPLQFHIGHRFRVLQIEPWAANLNTFQQQVDQMAVFMALDAERVERWEAFQPGLASTTVGFGVQQPLTDEVHVRLRGSGVWLRQQFASGSRIDYLEAEGVDLVYSAHLQYAVNRLTLGAGYAGRYVDEREYQYRNGDHGFTRESQRFAQTELIAGYRIGRWLPQAMLRLPLDKQLSKDLDRTVGIGIQAVF